MKWLRNRCSALCNGAVQRRRRHKPEVKNNKETAWRTTLPPGSGLCFLSCCCCPDKGHWLSQSLACAHFLLFDQSWLHRAASGCAVCFQPSKAVSSTLSCPSVFSPLKAIDSDQDSGYPRLVIEARALLQSATFPILALSGISLHPQKECHTERPGIWTHRSCWVSILVVTFRLHSVVRSRLYMALLSILHWTQGGEQFSLGPESFIYGAPYAT